jgi:stearoyl-CoA desaturase (delta-9 desaturase)
MIVNYRSIAPVENTFVSYVSFGEGWHNYHHVFPSDYRAAEIGGGRFNTTTSIINFFAKLGWAYDLKSPSDSLVNSTIANRGDGTHEKFNGGVQNMHKETKEHSS